MITLVETPGAITMSRNTSVFRLRATDALGVPYGARGAYATLTATPSARLATSATITVTLTDADGLVTTVVFTAVASPVTETQLPNSAFVGTNSAYWAAVAAVINGHRQVAPYARCTAAVGASAELRLQARSTDPAWAIELATSAGYTAADFTAAADSTPDNYAVLLEVYVERTYGAGDYTLEATLEPVPDADGYMAIDVSNVLEASARTWRAEPLVPVWGTALPYVADNLRRYYVRYTEQSGAPVTTDDWTLDTTRLVMWGGVAQSLWAEGNYLASITSDNSLLTWHPTGRKVPVAGPLWLGWYNYLLDPTQVRLQVKTYSIVDGTLLATTNVYTIDADVKQSVAFPVDATSLGITTTNVYKYTVRVQYYDDSETWQTASGEMTYNIDDQYFEGERWIQYVNGFGMPEAWRCTGDYSEAANVERDLSTRSLLPGAGAFSTETYQYQSDLVPGITYRTGYISRAEASTLVEMLVVGEVYEVSAAGYLPLRVTTNTFEVTSTRRALHAYEIQCVPRLRVGTFSKRPTDAGATLPAWQEPNGTYWLTALFQPWLLP